MSPFERAAIDCAKATLAAHDALLGDDLIPSNVLLPPAVYDARDKARALLDEALRSGVASVAECNS
ncbi:MAG: hypothetical protein WC273_10650 [Dehalococcoidia bacterium]